MSRFVGVPEIILFNGKVITVDEKFSIAEAVAIKGGRFLAVGDNARIKGLAGPGTKQIDLKGKTMVPGFIDGHQHFLGAGMTFLAEKRGLSLAHVRSIADIKKVVEKAVETRKPGDWIVTTPIGEPPANALVPGILKEKRLPNRWDLDPVSPNNPVWISFSSNYNEYRHGIANSYALRLANVTKDTPSAIPGTEINGEVLKDPKTGEPIGIFELGHGFRTHPVSHVLPEALDDNVEAVKEACKRFAAAGVTSVLDIHSGNASWVKTYQEVWARNELTIRVTASLAINRNKPLSEIRTDLRNFHAIFQGIGDDMFKVRGVTGLDIDGPPTKGKSMQRFEQIGANGKREKGLQVLDTELHKQICLECARLDLQVMTKATGGAAIDICLANYEEVDEEIPLKGRRWMMQHCFFLGKENAEQCSRLGVIPPAHTNFLWGSGSSTLKAYGREVADQVIPVRWMLDAGAKVVQASDWGHGAWGYLYQPMFVIWQSIARKDGVTGEVFGPDQKITREEAIRIYTINGAYATFEEDKKGSIEPGKLADLVVLSNDILTCPLDHIKDTEVLMTMVGGKTVYENRK